MRKIVISGFAAALLVASAPLPATAQIAFNVGAKDQSASAVTGTGTESISPTASTPVIVFLSISSASSSVSCSLGGAGMTAGPQTAAFNSKILYSFYLSAPSLTAGFSCTWTGSSGFGLVAGNWTGNAGGLNAGLTASSSGNTCSGATCTGNNGTATLTVTTEDANDWIVCGFADGGNTISLNTGAAQREQITTTTFRETLIDNTVASAGSLTCSGTLTSSNWGGVVIELRLQAAAALAGFDKRRKLSRLGVFQ